MYCLPIDLPLNLPMKGYTSFENSILIDRPNKMKRSNAVNDDYFENIDDNGRQKRSSVVIRDDYIRVYKNTLMMIENDKSSLFYFYPICHSFQIVMAMIPISV